MHVLLALASAFMALVVIGYLLFCVDNLLNLRSFRVGYTGSNTRLCGPHLDDIIKRYVADTSQVTFIEPGSGFAYIARYAARKHQWKKIVAVEVRPFTSYLAQLFNLKQNAPIQYVCEDALQFEYPKGSVVYSYLSTKIIDRLYQEKKWDGCLVISLTFAITGVKPTEEIRLPSWQQRLWVYDLRRK